MTKYGARKTRVDGITFDSAAEARYYCELKLRKRVNEIEDFEIQPVFWLLRPFAKGPRRFRGIKYVADFLVKHNDGRKEVIDVKGMRTAVYLIKRQLFEHTYPELTITEVTR